MSKTICTLTAITELGLRNVLIIAPKKVAECTWQAEAGKWGHTQGLRISTVLGTLKQRLAALEADADIYIINRDNVRWLVSQYKPGAWPFTTVVLDESSSFKNARSDRFKALKTVLPKIDRLIELTGTPSPKGLEDLWAQVYLLDGGRRLGRTLTSYREAWFRPDARSGMQIYSWRPREGADREIEERISDICVSMKAEDYIQLPEMLVDDIPVKLGAQGRATYEAMERDMILQFAEEESAITASSAAVLTGKLLQLSNGAVYDEGRQVREIHRDKLEALTEALEGLHGQHALIVYAYQHDLDRLRAALPEAVPYRSPADLDAWNEGGIRYLLVHPASCGYGLNLQRGGHHIFWFGLTWNLELYQQTNARLHRQGQTEPVVVHHLIVQGTRDEDVIRALARKDRVQESLLESIKARIQEVRAG